MKPNKFAAFTPKELEEIRQAFCFSPRRNHTAITLFEKLVEEIDKREAETLSKITDGLA